MNIVDVVSFEKGDNNAFLERKGYRTYSLTYKELKERMLKTETYLKRENAKKGDRILVQASNSVNYAVLLLAALHIGIVIVPLDPFATKAFRKKIMGETGPKLVFVDLDNLDKKTKNLPPNESFPEVSAADVAEIIYTSGTTGIPKGVVLTHENIYSNVMALKKGFGFRLRHISVLPLSHMLEQSCGLFLPLSNGSSILYPHSLRYSDLIDLIRYKKINAMTAVPGILEGLKKAIELRKKSFRKLLGWQFWIMGAGGATLPSDLEDWWRKKVLLLQGYGLTETSPIITTNLPFRKRKYSLGGPLEDVEVRIRDREIQVQGKNVMKEYYNKPEETKESFEDGWFKTGDLGEIRKGFLYFKGRKKDIIVTKAGLNVYPEDVEKKLMKYAKESCVLEKNGSVHAVLIVEKDDPEMIIEKVNKELEPHQKIVSYSIWKGEFPKTPTGKIRKYEVREKIKHPAFEHKNKLYELLSSSLDRRIKNIPLVSLGMDSLKRMEILALIEENYGLELNEKDITEKTTPKDLEKLISEKKKIYSYDFSLPKLGFVGNALAFLAMHLFCRVKCGRKIAFNGLIVSNHASVFDTPVIASCIKAKYAVATLPEVMGIGEKGIKIKHKLRSFFVRRLFNTYPFGSEVGLENSLRFTAHLLDKGYSIIVFPEGQMTRDGKMHEFREGIGFLSQNMDAEILPVRTDGLFSILPYNKVLPRFGKVVVKIGRQFWIKRMPYFKATKIIEKKVKEL